MDLWQDQQTTIILIAAFFLAFYVAGAFAGRRRLIKIYKNICEAVLGAGGKVVGGRYGTTTAVISCKDMGVLTEFSAVIGVLTWSNPFTYVISRSMGRFDLVILRARLRKIPKSSFTLIKKDAPAIRYASRWGSVVNEIDGYLIVSRDSIFDEVALHDIFQKVKGFENTILLSVSKELPHLQLYFKPENMDDIKALFSVLEKLI